MIHHDYPLVKKKHVHGVVCDTIYTLHEGDLLLHSECDTCCLALLVVGEEVPGLESILVCGTWH